MIRFRSDDTLSWNRPRAMTPRIDRFTRTIMSATSAVAFGGSMRPPAFGGAGAFRGVRRRGAAGAWSRLFEASRGGGGAFRGVEYASTTSLSKSSQHASMKCSSKSSVARDAS